MGKRKKEDDTLLTKKRRSGKKHVSVNGKGTVFPVKLKLQGIVWMKKLNEDNEEKLYVHKNCCQQQKKMVCKIYLNIACTIRTCYGKYWKRFSLLTGLFNVKQRVL